MLLGVLIGIAFGFVDAFVDAWIQVSGTPSPFFPAYVEQLLWPSGHGAWNRSLVFVLLVSFSIYISVQRTRWEAALAAIAYYDPLTGLANRALLQDRLGQDVAQARRQQQLLAVLFIDLDNLKAINDSHGHEIGDRLLSGFAKRLHSALRECDTVARIGGDEFVVVLKGLDDTRHVARIAQKILDAIRRPLVIDGRELVASASIGISIYPLDGLSVSALLNHADDAMYHVKHRGKNGFEFYTKDMNARSRERMRLEADLQGAMERGEFELHYQPQFDANTFALAGVEALIRWRRPAHGLVPPLEFIPAAEESGLAGQLALWVVRTACNQAKTWRTEGWDLPVSINVSPGELMHDGFPAAVGEALGESGIEPSALSIELTESVLLEDLDALCSRLQALKSMGVRIVLDGYGANHFPLAQLGRLGLDALKIDKSYVQQVARGREAQAIVRSQIALAQGLGVATVASGVETEEQVAYLREQQCKTLQGYYLGQPLPAASIAELLARGTTGAYTTQ